jgi:hypothetical protein
MAHHRLRRCLDHHASCHPLTRGRRHAHRRRLPCWCQMQTAEHVDDKSLGCRVCASRQMRSLRNTVKAPIESGTIRHHRARSFCQDLMAWQILSRDACVGLTFIPLAKATEYSRCRPRAVHHRDDASDRPADEPFPARLVGKDAGRQTSQSRKWTKICLFVSMLLAKLVLSEEAPSLRTSSSASCF